MSGQWSPSADVEGPPTRSLPGCGKGLTSCRRRDGAGEERGEEDEKMGSSGPSRPPSQALLLGLPSRTAQSAALPLPRPSSPPLTLLLPLPFPVPSPPIYHPVRPSTAAIASTLTCALSRRPKREGKKREKEGINFNRSSPDSSPPSRPALRPQCRCRRRRLPTFPSEGSGEQEEGARRATVRAAAAPPA